jgi:hypothetical protein
VLRFWNNEVIGNLEGVLLSIARTLSPHPASQTSPDGRGEDALSRRCARDLSRRER